MTIPGIKLLWGRADSKCTLCRRRLDQLTDAGKPAHLGEAAHIVADSGVGWAFCNPILPVYLIRLLDYQQSQVSSGLLNLTKVWC